jgi:hypothetical protein
MNRAVRGRIQQQREQATDLLDANAFGSSFGPTACATGLRRRNNRSIGLAGLSCFVTGFINGPLLVKPAALI